MPARISGEDLKVARIASLTLVNAMIFHQVLSAHDERVTPLQVCLTAGNAAEELSRTWKYVLDEIDYVPIFTLARSIVDELAATPGIDGVLNQLARAATRITSRRAALRHDLMGRIYHRLLADAKYFGAFYTTVPAAALLLKLVLDPAETEIDWSDVDAIRELRVSDLACGTGTLLKAALQTIVDNHVRARAEAHSTPDLSGLHQALVEHTLWGFDVVAFAIHLAASALAIHDPDVPFGDMHLYTLELKGRRPIKLGSLEFLREGRQAAVQADLFGGIEGPRRMTGRGEVSHALTAPHLDLCVMNPPFTRSVGGNLLFGNLPAAERRRMQEDLKALVQELNVQASVTAGLGSVFVALGVKLVKPSGHLALVLPRALLSGVAWKSTRRLIGANFQVRYIIVSHEAGAWNFSENTKLSECLIVADRWKRGTVPKPTKVVNLWVKPVSSIEALTFAKAIRDTDGAQLDGETGTAEVRSGSRKLGEIVLANPERMRSGLWGAEAAFAQTEVSRCAYYLSQGKVYLPGRGVVARVPLSHLRRIGTLGPDVRDIHDGFSKTDHHTSYAAFWGHETATVRQIAQGRSAFLSPLPRARKGRNLRDPHLLWSRAGRLLIVERLRLNLARLVALRLPEHVLSNTWWPFAPAEGGPVAPDDVERILAVWLNSSLGVLSIVAARVETEGSWIKLKKPILGALMVLDPAALTETQRAAVVAVYNDVSSRELRALPDMADDETRAILDRGLLAALGIQGDLGALRRAVSNEPLVKGA